MFFFVKLGIFCLELGKKHTFWHWEWGRISAQNRVIKSPGNDSTFPKKTIIQSGPKIWSHL